MKKILLTLALLTVALAANAQLVTNIAWRVQVETGTVGGATNTVTTNFRYDYGTAKDLLKINGYVFAWSQYVASGGTNTLNGWIKTDVADRATSYAAVKQQADNAALLAKLQSPARKPGFIKRERSVQFEHDSGQSAVTRGNDVTTDP